MADLHFATREKGAIERTEALSAVTQCGNRVKIERHDGKIDTFMILCLYYDIRREAVEAR